MNGNKMDDRADFLAAWDRSAETYDAYADRFSQYEGTSGLLVEVAGLSKRQAVVDLACGVGVTTRHILEAGGDSGTV